MASDNGGSEGYRLEAGLLQAYSAYNLPREPAEDAAMSGSVSSHNIGQNVKNMMEEFEAHGIADTLRLQNPYDDSLPVDAHNHGAENSIFNPHSDEMASAFADYLATTTCTSLTSLILVNCNVGDRGATALVESLKTNTTLKSLVLACDDSGYAGFEVIGNALAANSSLNYLYLEDIGHRGVAAMGMALEANCGLTKLEIMGCGNLGNFSAEDGPFDAVAAASVSVGCIGKGLAFNSTLRHLTFWDVDRLGAEVFTKSLGESLMTNTTLTQLELAFLKEDVEDDAFEALGKGLARNSSLKILRLNGGDDSNNLIGKRFGDRGVTGLVEGLKKNTTLEELEIGDCENIGDAGDRLAAHALGRAWGSNWKSNLAIEFGAQVYEWAPTLGTRGVLDARDDAIREYKLTAFGVGILHDRHLGPGLMPGDQLPEEQEQDERQLFTFHGMNADVFRLVCNAYEPTFRISLHGPGMRGQPYLANLPEENRPWPTHSY